MCDIFYISNTKNFMYLVYSILSRLNKSTMHVIKCVTSKNVHPVTIDCSFCLTKVDQRRAHWLAGHERNNVGLGRRLDEAQGREERRLLHPEWEQVLDHQCARRGHAARVRQDRRLRCQAPA